MTGKERIRTVLDHKNADTIAIDFSATNVSGIHCKAMESLRKYYGLDQHPVYVYEPSQMLGLMEDDLAEAMGIDTIGCFGQYNNFGIPTDSWKEFRMPWGQTVMLHKRLAESIREIDGVLYGYPEGDQSLIPSGSMPEGSFYFNFLEHQEGEPDEDNLNVDDNMEEFGEVDDATLEHWKKQVDAASKTGRAVVANLGGMGLGDIALIVGQSLKHPKGIRKVADWYMATVIHQDYIHEIFDRQTKIAIRNLEKFNAAFGDKVDIAFICGTDFGTQVGQFCSADTFRELYMPYYQRMNNWIHEHTGWKTFKHSCGAVLPLMDCFIESGFDIINPVQIAAADMDPKVLKSKFGDKLSFWGGGIDTQNTLPFGKPEDVRNEIFKLYEIFGKDGGFIFNSVHNVQANVPTENLIAMVDALKEIRNK